MNSLAVHILLNGTYEGTLYSVVQKQITIKSLINYVNPWLFSQYNITY